MRGDSDDPSLFPGGDVGSLQGFSPVDEARRVRVREQEHGALDTRSQEGRESDLVSVREGLYVHANRELLRRHEMKAEKPCREIERARNPRTPRTFSIRKLPI